MKTTRRIVSVGAPVEVWVMFDGFCYRMRETGGIDTAYYDRTSFSMDTIEKLTRYGLIYHDFDKPKIQNDDDNTHYFPEFPYTLTEFGKWCRATGQRYVISESERMEIK